ncbi:MAG TPA: FtsX-like permease family protein [Longimicrobiales bacterium]
MRAGFPLKLAWWEARSSARRLGLYMGAIGLGVAALVAINSFRADVVRAVAEEGRSLVGADVRLRSSGPFAPEVLAFLDSLEHAGVEVAYETRLPSMAVGLRSGRARLVEVQAVEGGYPFYGEVETEPAGLWPLDGGARRALADPAVLRQLGVGVGDTVGLGESRFVVAGTLADDGRELGVRGMVAGRLAIPAAFLEETGLVGVGSLVRRNAYLRLPGEGEAERFVEAHRSFLREHRVGIDTAEEEVEELSRGLGMLGRFLGLVGLMAVLLGGVGVASAVHVLVREKLPALAVLRCLGATQRDVFLAYSLQTGLLGLAGAAVGAVAGVGVQGLLPGLLGELLPVEVGYRVHWPSILAGLGMGAWVAIIFALLPLLAVREVAPLQALRRDIEPPEGRGGAGRLAARGALGASVVLLSVWQAPSWQSGLAFAAGVGLVLLALWGVATALARAARRFFPQRAPYVVRQGVSNLFRPRNQTVAVTLALGFGVFLIATIYLVQANLLERLRGEGGERPNLLFFDIQPDQRDGLRALLAERGTALEPPVPIVPARILALNGRPATELLADTTDAGPERWALRREYRNTYRDTLTATEALVAGKWWDGRAPARLPRISIEEDLARDLRVGIGDRITWDAQGVPIETEVASLRRVDWARFSPNFFVVFEPGVLEEAPQTLVALARVPDPEQRAELQDAVVRRFPNISVLDLSRVQEALDGVLSKVAFAVRGLALFTLAGGGVVLFGALVASRVQRQREAALLATLGASRRQVRLVQLTEYAALGALAGLAGTLLACLSAWLLVTRFFEFEFGLPALPLVSTWAAVPALAILVGTLNSRGSKRRTPLEVLREAAE